MPGTDTLFADSIFNVPATWHTQTKREHRSVREVLCGDEYKAVSEEALAFDALPTTSVTLAALRDIVRTKDHERAAALLTHKTKLEFAPGEVFAGNDPRFSYEPTFRVTSELCVPHSSGFGAVLPKTVPPDWHLRLVWNIGLTELPVDKSAFCFDTERRLAAVGRVGSSTVFIALRDRAYSGRSLHRESFVADHELSTAMDPQSFLETVAMLTVMLAWIGLRDERFKTEYPDPTDLSTLEASLGFKL